LDLPEVGPLTFSQPDLERFPCLDLALKAGRKGGWVPASLNAANEVAVKAFLEDDLSFPDIARVSASVLERIGNGRISRLEQVFQADDQARKIAREIISAAKGVLEKW
jgi:1-deoxy-D-xylulose-5-phosphate reductoisomerase